MHRHGGPGVQGRIYTWLWGPKRLGVVTSGWSVQLTATYAAYGAHVHSCMVHAPWTVDQDLPFLPARMIKRSLF